MRLGECWLSSYKMMKAMSWHQVAVHMVVQDQEVNCTWISAHYQLQDKDEIPCFHAHLSSEQCIQFGHRCCSGPLPHLWLLCFISFADYCVLYIDLGFLVYKLTQSQQQSSCSCEYLQGHANECDFAGSTSVYVDVHGSNQQEFLPLQ